MGLDAGLYASNKQDPPEVTEIGYWRKANQVQAWIEKEFPNFENCDTVVVSIDQLRDLKIRCLKIFSGADPNKLLPSRAGFFFGNTAYDDWYMNQLENTVDIILRAEQVYELNQDVEFTYHANW